MAKSRREFLVDASAGLFSVAVAAHAQNQKPTTSKSAAPQSTTSSQSEQPGTPSAFGTAPPVGPEVSPTTFAEAEKLVQVENTPAHRVEAADSWRVSMAPLYERRIGPQKVTLESTLAPYSRWDPVLPGHSAGPKRDQFIRSETDPGPLPASDEEIAFAPVTQLSRWIEKQKLTSQRLTNIYLARLERFNPKLRCVITLTREHALAQAKQADQKSPRASIADRCTASPGAQRPRSIPPASPPPTAPSPFETHPHRGCRGSQTSPRSRRRARRQAQHGRARAQRYLVRRPDHESLAARRRLFGLAAPARAATAAGLVGFSVGSETDGSIVSPSMRCGVTGLRPTYGRVPRTGAMTLCWSLDKLGPMARGVEDTMLVRPGPSPAPTPETSPACPASSTSTQART